MGPHDLVEVEVQALSGGTSVIDDAATFTFADGHDQEMEFILYRSCLHTDCAANPTRRACIGGGMCGDITISPLGGDLSVPADVDLAAPPDLSVADLDGSTDFAASTDFAGSDFAAPADFSSVDLASLEPVLDNATHTANSATSGLVWSHTVGSGANRTLIVGVCSNGISLVQGVTYGATNMTPLVDSVSGNLELSLYYLVAPPVGTADVSVTLNGGSDAMAGGALSFFNVSQTTPSAAPMSGTSTTATETVASAVGDLVVDAAITNGLGEPLTAGSTQTARVFISTGISAGDCALGMSTMPGVSSATMKWSLMASQFWEMAAINLTP
jgi:hypothetical protein